MLELKTAQKNLSLIVSKAPEIPDRLVGDPHKLGQILRNLGANAIKFTEHGEVRISVSLLELTESEICLFFQLQTRASALANNSNVNFFSYFPDGYICLTFSWWYRSRVGYL